MAHVGAVRKVVGAIHAREELVHVCRFQRGAAGSVERHRFRIELAQSAADIGECRFPGDRNVVIRRAVIAERVRQPASGLQRIVTPRLQLADGMLRKEFRCGALLREFPGRGFCAVLAELEDVRRCRLCPGTARTRIAARLVLIHQREAGTDRIAISGKVLGQALDRTPATGRSVVGAEFLPHRHASAPARQ